MTDITHVYKIRNKTTGLYSRGTSLSYNDWSKLGKTWMTLGQLRSYITLQISNGIRIVEFPDWEVVEFDLTEGSSKPVHDVIRPERLLDLLKAK